MRLSSGRLLQGGLSCWGTRLAMTAQPAPGKQDQWTTLLGWMLALSFLALFININILPRTPLDQRVFLRIIHDSLGRCFS